MSQIILKCVLYLDLRMFAKCVTCFNCVCCSAKCQQLSLHYTENSGFKPPLAIEHIHAIRKIILCNYVSVGMITNITKYHPVTKQTFALIMFYLSVVLERSVKNVLLLMMWR